MYSTYSYIMFMLLQYCIYSTRIVSDYFWILFQMDKIKYENSTTLIHKPNDRMSIINVD